MPQEDKELTEVVPTAEQADRVESIKQVTDQITSYLNETSKLSAQETAAIRKSGEEAAGEANTSYRRLADEIRKASDEFVGEIDEKRVMLDEQIKLVHEQARNETDVDLQQELWGAHRELQEQRARLGEVTLVPSEDLDAAVGNAKKVDRSFIDARRGQYETPANDTETDVPATESVSGGMAMRDDLPDTFVVEPEPIAMPDTPLDMEPEVEVPLTPAERNENILGSSRRAHIDTMDELKAWFSGAAEGSEYGGKLGAAVRKTYDAVNKVTKSTWERRPAVQAEKLVDAAVKNMVSMPENTSRETVEDLLRYKTLGGYPDVDLNSEAGKKVLAAVEAKYRYENRRYELLHEKRTMAEMHSATREQLAQANLKLFNEVVLGELEAQNSYRLEKLEAARPESKVPGWLRRSGTWAKEKYTSYVTGVPAYARIGIGIVAGSTIAVSLGWLLGTTAVMSTGAVFGARAITGAGTYLFGKGTARAYASGKSKQIRSKEEIASEMGRALGVVEPGVEEEDAPESLYEDFMVYEQAIQDAMHMKKIEAQLSRRSAIAGMLGGAAFAVIGGGLLRHAITSGLETGGVASSSWDSSVSSQDPTKQVGMDFSPKQAKVFPEGEPFLKHATTPDNKPLGIDFSPSEAKVFPEGESLLKHTSVPEKPLGIDLSPQQAKVFPEGEPLLKHDVSSVTPKPSAAPTPTPPGSPAQSVTETQQGTTSTGTTSSAEQPTTPSGTEMPKTGVVASEQQPTTTGDPAPATKLTNPERLAAGQGFEVGKGGSIWQGVKEQVQDYVARNADASPEQLGIKMTPEQFQSFKTDIADGGTMSPENARLLDRIVATSITKNQMMTMGIRNPGEIVLWKPGEGGGTIEFGSGKSALYDMRTGKPVALDNLPQEQPAGTGGVPADPGGVKAPATETGVTKVVPQPGVTRPVVNTTGTSTITTNTTAGTIETVATQPAVGSVAEATSPEAQEWWMAGLTETQVRRALPLFSEFKRVTGIDLDEPLGVGDLNVKALYDTVPAGSTSPVRIVMETPQGAKGIMVSPELARIRGGITPTPDEYEGDVRTFLKNRIATKGSSVLVEPKPSANVVDLKQQTPGAQPAGNPLNNRATNPMYRPAAPRPVPITTTAPTPIPKPPTNP